MIIDDEGTLLAWIIRKIPITCDAEPTPFAKYVLALLRKNPDDDECHEVCLNQLDVFLKSETENFVKELFNAVRSKSYLNIPINEEAEVDGNSSKMAEISPQDIRTSDVADSENIETNEVEVGDSSSNEGKSKPVRPRILPPQVGEEEKEQMIVSAPIRRQLQRLRVAHERKRMMSDENSDEEYEQRRYLVKVRRRSSRSRSRSPIREVRVRHDRSKMASQPPCHDYEVLGYCVRGSICPFKHSIQPITVPAPQMFPAIPVADEGYNPEAPALTTPLTLRQITNRQGILPIRMTKQRGRLTNSILVRKIPPANNNIQSINEFFQQFGDVKNIQVSFEGTPDTALVTYEQPASATRAFQSKKPIFDNRFVYVMYYTPQEPQEQIGNTAPAFASSGFGHQISDETNVKPKTFPVRPVSDYAKTYVPSATAPTSNPSITQPKKILSKVQQSTAELLKLKTDLYLKLNEQLQLVLQDAKMSKDESKKREVLQRVNGLEQKLQEIRNDLFRLKSEVHKGN